MRPLPLHRLFHRLGAAAAGLLAAGHVLAHPGHGMPEVHAHPTDAWGFAVLAVCVAAALACGRGK